MRDWLARLFGRKELTAAQAALVREYLAALDRAGGFHEGSPDLDAWQDVAATAEARGLASGGGGWGVWTTITPRGRAFLASSPAFATAEAAGLNPQAY